jgi:hypothetical protein
MLRDGAHTIYLSIFVGRHADCPTGKLILLDLCPKDFTVEPDRSVQVCHQDVEPDRLIAMSPPS